MGEAEHEAAATQQEEATTAHEAEYDPSAKEAHTQCTPSSGMTRWGGACWTSVTNPTEEHLKRAEKARKAAEAHREAAASLAAAEETACKGIAPDDRDMSPFEHPEDIASVEPHVRTRGGGKGGRVTTVNGATVTFLAVPGMTAEWLQRVVDCHLTRNAALGHDVPEMPDCPLVPKGAEAKVSSTGTGFAVDIWADEAETGDEILARARRLVPSAAAR